MTDAPVDPRAAVDALRSALQKLRRSLPWNSAVQDDVDQAFTHLDTLAASLTTQQDQLIAVMNETTRLLDVERRRWYAALAMLGDLEGWAPEVVGAKFEVALEHIIELVDALFEGDARHVQQKQDAESKLYKLQLAYDALQQEQDALPCPHCHLPRVLPEPCTPEVNAVIEQGIAHSAALHTAGYELGRQELEAERAALAASEARRNALQANYDLALKLIDKLGAQSRDLEQRALVEVRRMLSPGNQNLVNNDLIASLRDVAQVYVTAKDNAREAVIQLAASEARIREREAPSIQAHQRAAIAQKRQCPTCKEWCAHGFCGRCEKFLEGAVPSGEASGPSQVDCPLCGQAVVQVSSATLSLALWQHVNWVCHRKDGRLTHEAAAVLALTHGQQQDQQRIAELEAENVTLKAQREQLRKNLTIEPCVVCGWPVPLNDEGYICECCGFEQGLDDPSRYQWDGTWWAKDDERQPKILAVADAARQQAEQERDELWKIIEESGHESECAIFGWADKCDCGAMGSFQTAIKDLRPSRPPRAAPRKDE